MIQLILLVLGISYAFHRPKIKRLEAEQFPGLSPDTFRKWRALKLKTIDTILWAGWGTLALNILVTITLEAIGTTGDTQFNVALFLELPVFLILLILAAIYDRRAAKLEEQMLQATSKDYFELAELMLGRKADLSVRDKSGHTRLHIAATKDQQDVAALLLANRADVNARDNDGVTPLHYAAFKGNEEFAKLLLANQADVNAKDNDGETPLHLAIEERHERMAELLRQHGGHE